MTSTSQKLIANYLEDLRELSEHKSLSLDELSEFSDTLEQLKLEARALMGENKASLLTKIQHFTHKLSEFKRIALVGTAVGKPTTETALQQGNLDRLAAARQQLAETEAVGAETLTELEKQRSKLTGIKSNLHDVNADLNIAQRFVNSMSRWWRG
jgi:hypothetical protein